jgi:hypothetical protein
MSSGKKNTTTTSTSVSQAPAWAQPYYEDALGMAKGMV